MQVKVRKGYVYHYGHIHASAGDTIDITEDEYNNNRWRFEPIVKVKRITKNRSISSDTDIITT